MSLLNKKSDVQRHLSSHGRKHPHIAAPAAEPDGTGFSAVEGATPEPSASVPVLQPGAKPVWTVFPVRVAEPPVSAVSPKAPGMAPHTVFLRIGCVLPNGVELLQEPLGKGWTIVQDVVAAALDRKIRDVGWHFMWMHDSASRRGLGTTDESAIRSALTHALAQVRARFNAAELDSLQVAHYPGFRVAKVALHARQIQQNTALDSIAEIGR